MKNSIILLLISILTVFNCTSRIITKKDEINDKTIIKMNLYFIPGEHTIIKYIDAEFMREISNKAKNETQVKLTIHPIRPLLFFSDIVSLQVDNKKYKIKMNSITGDILYGLASSKSISEITRGLENFKGNDLSPILILDEKIIKEISVAQNIMFSISAGSDFAFFKFKKSDIDSMHKFITYKMK